MENLMYVVPVVSVLALLFAGYLAVKVAKQEEGTEKMKEIASAISEGARAFLTAEYKILIVFVIVLFLLIGFGIGNWVTAICFVVYTGRLLWHECCNKGECKNSECCQRKWNE